MTPRANGVNGKKENGNKRNHLKEKVDKYLPSIEQLKHLPKVLSLRERYLVLFLAIVALGSLVVIPFTSYYHYTKAAPDFGGEFSEGVVGTPKKINPLLSQNNDVDRDLSALIYAGLMKYGPDGKLVPDLAESYQISNDGLVYTFKLRDNLFWHDGKPLTAEDVVFTVLVAQNQDYDSFQRINWQGAEVAKFDDKTVVFKIKNKYAQFLNNTTLGILPKHIWENVKPNNFGLADTNLKPIGAGPFKFSKIKKDSKGNIISFELKAFKKYHKGQPYISKITFKFYPTEDELINAYNNSNINNISSINPLKLNYVRFLGQLNIERVRMPRYFTIFFNQTQSKALSDKNVRLALNYATDKKQIIEKLLNGNGAEVYSPMLPGIIDVTDNVPKYEFNKEKAIKLLDDAGWKYSEQEKVRIKESVKSKKETEITKLEIDLTTSNWPELVSAANQVKNQWEEIGARVNIKVLSLPELQQSIKDKGYQSLLFGEVLGLDPDPFSFWHSSQKRDSGLNLALYDNKDADKLLDDSRQTLNRTARLLKYEEFQKLVVNDTPVVFLYSPHYLYGKSFQIKGDGNQIIATPADRFGNVSHWYIATKREFKK